METLVTGSFWANRRVLLTGHTGFKGSWLSLWLLRAGAEVIGFSDGVPTTPSLFEVARLEEDMTSLQGDVRDGAHLRRCIERHRPEVVFHLAAQPLVRRSYREPVLTYETNVIGAVNLLEAVRATAGVEVVVVVTSDKVYANPGGRRFREGDSLGGGDPYSTSKAAAELVAAGYRESFFQAEAAPRVATARAGNVIGGGDWAEDRLVPDLVTALSEGSAVTIRNPGFVRPWQHVLNALDGYLRLARALAGDRSLTGAWNFGPDGDGARSVEWIARRFAELWGAELRVVAADGAQPREERSLELDSSAARAALGWAPTWDVERALAATVDWYRGLVAGEDPRELTLAQIGAFVSERSSVTA